MNYYNEFDPKAAAWLRELIKNNLIPAGHVDTRSIANVTSSDLEGYTQCHFFAGVAGWPLSLSMAGWPADRPVWTGSCPCQPFSEAGEGKGEADPRHLWPAWFNLIRERRPAEVLGEQVASKAALGWFDGVSADLESTHYAAGAFDLCSAGVSAPNIRQRLYFAARDTTISISAWLGDSDRQRLEFDAQQDRKPQRPELQAPRRDDAGGSGELDGPAGHLQYPEGDRRGERRSESIGRGASPRCGDDGSPSILPHTNSRQRNGLPDGEGRVGDRSPAERMESRRAPSASRLTVSQLALPDGRQPSHRDLQRGGEHGQQPQDGGAGVALGDTKFEGLEGHAGHGNNGHESGRLDAPASGSIAPTGGANFWSDFELIYCRDGKVRRIEPGLEPLVAGVPGRVALLRGFGNSINVEIAAEFVRSYLDIHPTP